MNPLLLYSTVGIDGCIRNFSRSRSFEHEAAVIVQHARVCEELYPVKEIRVSQRLGAFLFSQFSDTFPIATKMRLRPCSRLGSVVGKKIGAANCPILQVWPSIQLHSQCRCKYCKVCVRSMHVNLVLSHRFVFRAEVHFCGFKECRLQSLIFNVLYKLRHNLFNSLACHPRGVRLTNWRELTWSSCRHLHSADDCIENPSLPGVTPTLARQHKAQNGLKPICCLGLLQ
mmetsp:Transcript_71671/g.113548  ORF Transcript_71671/g.113548 Transcript_71671/m.113548 type:complete len:228 (-) Transcript_71671:191-874(-)